MHIHSGDLAVFIGGVVINAFVGIAAAGVQGNLVLTVVQLAAAALLLYRAENMEKLAHAFCFAFPGAGVGAHESRPYKPRLRRKIPRQTHGPHAAAVSVQRHVGCKVVAGCLWGKLHIIIQSKQLHGERRVVGKHTGGVIIYMQAVFGRFQRDALMIIGNHPVQAGNGQPFAERGIHQVHAVQQGAGILYGSAAAQQPGDQLKLGNIIFAGFIFAIPGVAHKVQPGNA